jgi:hypothetical protein
MSTIDASHSMSVQHIRQQILLDFSTIQAKLKMDKQNRKHANSLQKIVSNHTKLDAEIAQYFVESNMIIHSPPVHMQTFNDVHPTTLEEQHHDHRLYTMASNDAQVQAKNYPLRNDYPGQASSVSSLRCMDTLKSKGLEAPAPQASRGPKRQRPWKIKHAGEGVNDGPDSDFGTYPVHDLGAVIERGRQKKGLLPLP